MTTYRFTAKTRCGRTDVVVMDAPTLDMAKRMAKEHVWDKHTPVEVTKTEVKRDGVWERC